MNPNRKNLKVVLEFIKNNPDKWRQDDFWPDSRGARCFLGVAFGPSFMDGDEKLEISVRNPQIREYLGITPLEFIAIYSATNSLEDLESLVNQYTRDLE